MLYLFCWSLVWYFFAFHPKGSDDDFKVKKLFFGSDATKQLILGHLGPTCLSPAAGNAFHRVRLWFAASQALLLCPTEALKGFEIIWDRGDQNPSCVGIVHISRYVSLVTSYAHQKAARDGRPWGMPTCHAAPQVIDDTEEGSQKSMGNIGKQHDSNMRRVTQSSIERCVWVMFGS